MEKLDKVIAGLSGCIICNCSNCEYAEADKPHRHCWLVLMEDALEVLRNMEPVVHAHWEDAYGGKYANPRYQCSACKARALYRMEQDVLLTWHDVQSLTERCHHCGAHMDEELRTCYCPLCDKHFEIHSNESSGSCPDCGHHVALHREGVTK